MPLIIISQAFNKTLIILVKVRFALKQAMKAQRGSTGTALIFF